MTELTEPNPAVEYSLADLESLSFSGSPLAVLGHPVKHSISPQMHNSALTLMADADPKYSKWRYFKFDIHPDDLPEALTLLHKKKFRGIEMPSDLSSITSIDYENEVPDGESGLSEEATAAIWDAVQKFYAAGMHPLCLHVSE